MSKYLGSWQSDGKSIPEKFCHFSNAYLDSAERLCKVLIRSTRKASYERGAVVIYLTFHSVELFLKAAILQKCPEEYLNHNIEHYEKRYKNLYPAKKYRFEIPFKTTYYGHEPPEIKNISPPIEQVHRYPTDKDGKEWDGIFAFEPTSFLSDIQAIKSDTHKLRREIFNVSREN